mmetsp:Transcript_46537/g.150075  ORF Transcript_46537/g.150075 Transcript_46537/m.150075 type:complete len:299 (-) Transcript_46537:262-1158(-)
MAIVVYLLKTVDAAEQPASGFSEIMVYQEHSSDDAATIAGGVALNALAMVALLFVVTSGLVLLYRFSCYAAIYGFLLFSVVGALFVSGSELLRGVRDAYDPAGTLPDLAVLAAAGAFAPFGTAAVFWSDLGCARRCGFDLPRSRQTSLVLISAIIAYNLTKLPEWTTWGVLGAVALWDIVAVLTPRGPLKVLVETAEQRNEPIPGLVYEGHGIKLGLGDFVFYSLLVGRACLSSITAFAACAIAVLAGLCATLALLPVLERVLPALPISVAVGILFYFISSSLIEPLAAFAADQSLFL